MGVTDWVATLFDDGQEIYECRECGTNLTSMETDCPYCGPTDVVRLDIGR